MDAVDTAIRPNSGSSSRPPRVWGFWGTALWGLAATAAMFVGQFATLAWFLLRDGGSLGLSEGVVTKLASNGLVISLSIILGLPAVMLVLYIATRMARMSYADYLGLRWPNWRQFLSGLLSLVVLVVGWDLLSRALGREVTPGFMVDVMKTALADGQLWLLVIAFCIAAPIAEELLARGFLYRGWSESVVRPAGAILLSSLAWTALHLQYDLFFFGQVFSIGILFGILRQYTGSTWLTIILHGINNLAATMQGVWLAQP